MQVLGSSKKVIISKDDTIFIEGYGDKNLVQERVSEIKEAIANTTSTYDKEKFQEKRSKEKAQSYSS